jgi:RNA polymerase sigma-70 factor (ECF subfamily)
VAHDIDLDSVEFLSRLRAGEDLAAEELVRQTSGQLLAVARRMLMNDEDAADALQETYLSVFRRIGDFHGDSKLRTWIHRIAINACLINCGRNAVAPP